MGPVAKCERCERKKRRSCFLQPSTSDDAGSVLGPRPQAPRVRFVGVEVIGYMRIGPELQPVELQTLESDLDGKGKCYDGWVHRVPLKSTTTSVVSEITLQHQVSDEKHKICTCGLHPNESPDLRGPPQPCTVILTILLLWATRKEPWNMYGRNEITIGQSKPNRWFGKPIVVEMVL